MLLAVSKATGIDGNYIPRIATGLGGGLGLQGEVCGALTGGVLVLGLLHGRDRLEDTDRKEATYVKAGEFVRGFARVNGAARCRDLLDLKIDTPEGLEQYYARDMKSERCTPVVRNAVRLLLESLSAQKNAPDY